MRILPLLISVCIVSGLIGCSGLRNSAAGHPTGTAPVEETEFREADAEAQKNGYMTSVEHWRSFPRTFKITKGGYTDSKGRFHKVSSMTLGHFYEKQKAEDLLIREFGYLLWERPRDGKGMMIRDDAEYQKHRDDQIQPGDEIVIMLYNI